MSMCSTTPGGLGRKDKTYIVRSTLCYNTSTQTDPMPGTVTEANPVSPAHESRQESQHRVLTLPDRKEQLLPWFPVVQKDNSSQVKCIQTELTGEFKNVAHRHDNLPHVAKYSTRSCNTIMNPDFNNADKIHDYSFSNELSGTRDKRELLAVYNAERNSPQVRMDLTQNSWTSGSGDKHMAPTLSRRSAWSHQADQSDDSEDNADSGVSSGPAQTNYHVDRGNPGLVPSSASPGQESSSRLVDARICDTMVMRCATKGGSNEHYYNHLYQKVQPVTNYLYSSLINDPLEVDTTITGAHHRTIEPFQLWPESSYDNTNLSFSSGLGSDDASSIVSHTKSFYSDHISSRRTSFDSIKEPQLRPVCHMASATTNSVCAQLCGAAHASDGINKTRNGSDSVFEDDDDNKNTCTEDEENGKKPCQVRSYGDPNQPSGNNFPHVSGHHIDQPHVNGQNWSSHNGLGRSAPKDSGSSSSVSSGSRSLSESIANVIVSVNENLARSAQRVGNLRLWGSRWPRNSIAGLDSVHQRNSRQTDWSRLRCSESLMHLSDFDRSTNRSCLSTENLSDVTAKFAPARRRSSCTGSREPMFHGATRRSSIENSQAGSAGSQDIHPSRQSLLQPSGPDIEVPSLPPRSNIEKCHQQTMTMRTAVAQPQESTRAQVSSRHSLDTLEIPRKQQSNPNNLVDSRKENFKALIAQWNSSSPGSHTLSENRVTTPTEQQYLNATAACYERTRPTISYATVYKREQAFRQEATGPLMSPLLVHSATVSVPSLPSKFSKPSALTSSAHYQPGFQHSTLPNSHILSTTTHSLSSQPSQLIPKAITDVKHNSLSTPKNSENNAAHLMSSDDPTTHLSLSQQRSSQHAEYCKNRGAETINSHLYKPAVLAVERGISNVPRVMRDRSASDNDLLSEKQRDLQTFSPDQYTFWQASYSATRSQPKWTSAQCGLSETIENGENQLDFTSEVKRTAAPSASCIYSGDNDPSSSNGQTYELTEESCKSFKNKPSSIMNDYIYAVAPTFRGTVHGDENSDGSINATAHKSKFGLQSWNSELILPHREDAINESPRAGMQGQINLNGNIRASQEHLNQLPVPVRPPRPLAEAKHRLGRLPATSVPSALSRSHIGNYLSAPGPKSAANTLVADRSETVTPRDITGWTSPKHQSPRPLDGLSQREGTHQKGNLTRDRSQYSSVNKSLHTTPLLSSNCDSSALSRSCGHSNSSDPLFPAREYLKQELAFMMPVSSTSNVNRKTFNLYPGTARLSRRCSDGNISFVPRAGFHIIEGFSRRRQPSQEELECDEKARQLGEELRDTDNRLADVLLSNANQKRMFYMNGLYPETEYTKESTAIQKSDSSNRSQIRLQLFNSCINLSSSIRRYPLAEECRQISPDVENSSQFLTGGVNETLNLFEHKKELLEKILRKLEVLKTEKLKLEQKIADNTQLGKQVCQWVDSKCNSQTTATKFQTHIGELETVTCLLLNLSGQLARAENAIRVLDPQADINLKKQTTEKRDMLMAKHDEAKLLKDDIDKRTDQLLEILYETLDENEITDCHNVIKMKSVLPIQLQEVCDTIALAEEQALEIKKSISDSAFS